MKATDFDLSKELRLDPETGVAVFRGNRLVVLDAGALGLLRQHILERLGFETAREIFFRFGYQHGYSDFLQMKLAYQFDSEMDLLASGPVIHTWEGIVKATPTEIRFDRQTGEFYFTGVWTNSYEAEQFISYNHPAQEAVCWSLTGYASGWSTAFFGRPLLATEPLCMGKGDPHCSWLIQPVDAYGKEADPFRKVLNQMQGEK